MDRSTGAREDGRARRCSTQCRLAMIDSMVKKETVSWGPSRVTRRATYKRGFGQEVKGGQGETEQEWASH